MRLFGIDKITFIGNTDRISSFHYVMFHGEAERPGAKKHTPEYYGHGDRYPLSIRRPGNDIPSLCQPQTNFVVDADLANELRRIPNIELLQVSFASLFEMNFPKGDMWWYRPPRGDPSRFAQSTSDEREKFDSIPDCFEVLDARYKMDIQGEFPDCRTYRFEGIELDVGFEDRGEVQASEAMMQRYPIISNSFHIVSEQVFAILDPHIDRDYFIVVEAKRV